MKRDFTIDVIRLLDNLKGLAEKPKTIVGLTFGYNAEEMVMQIEKVKASLPRDLKDAASMAKESERIVQNAAEEADTMRVQAEREGQSIVEEAKREAERIISQARLEQERMLGENEVLKLAKAQSDELRNNAEREAQQLRRGAERYAADTLTQLESVVGRVLNTIERGKAELDTSESPVPVRERAKVL